MNGDFSKNFHRQTGFDFPIGMPPLDPQYWPKEWTEIYHKNYPRMAKVKLSENLLVLAHFADH